MGSKSRPKLTVKVSFVTESARHQADRVEKLQQMIFDAAFLAASEDSRSKSKDK
jgi:hypothetical protein